MTGPLSDQHLDEIAERARLAYDGADPLQTIGYDVPALVAEIRRLHGELVQAARSERDRYTAENRRLRAELADVAGYLAAIHRHASRHDVLGVDLGCAGCALLARIEGTPAEPDRVPLRTPTPGRSDAHFSPGYTGETPDHHGVFETCAMPACVTSRRQHEAAASIQNLTCGPAGDGGAA